MRVDVAANGGRLSIEDRSGRSYQYLAVWLRDNCSGQRFRNPVSGQKRFDITDVPEDVRIAWAQIVDNDLQVRFEPEGLESTFALRSLCQSHPLQQNVQPRFWRQIDWPTPPDPYAYPELVDNPAALAACLEDILRHGFALVSDMPAKSGAVAEFVALFGEIRETNYGRIFDVRAETDPNNFANSSMALPLHTDNPYRQPVPGLQLLHVLDRDDRGGETILADGHAVATDFAVEAPEGFSLLSTMPVPFRYQDQKVDLSARVPLIECDCQGNIATVRYNNRSIAPFDHETDIMEAYYCAYRCFAEKLKCPDYHLTMRLDPGFCLIMDNHRVLHGRTALTGSGRRHLQGCYAEKDGLLSAWRRLKSANGAEEQT